VFVNFYLIAFSYLLYTNHTLNIITTKMLDPIRQQCLRHIVDVIRSYNINIDLPNIAVVGDTSSGKSTLLSHLTGV